jgi:hypothetical protein
MGLPWHFIFPLLVLNFGLAILYVPCGLRPDVMRLLSECDAACGRFACVL